MKKIISTLLALILVLGCFPVSAFAAGNDETCAVAPYSSNASLIEVTREGAPIRTGPGERYSTVVKCELGTVLEKTDTTINRYLNRWYKVTYRDSQSNVIVITRSSQYATRWVNGTRTSIENIVITDMAKDSMGDSFGKFIKDNQDAIEIAFRSL
jgi:hypothetical protein